MKKVLSGLTLLMILSLTACGSLTVQGDVIPAAEATKQSNHLSSGALQLVDRTKEGVSTPVPTATSQAVATETPSSAPAEPTDQGTGMPVVGWAGFVISLPAGSQFDDYFLLAGDNPVQYGIDSALADPSGERELADEIAVLRDSGKTVRIWGEMVCDVPDVGGCQIVVWKIDVDGTIYEITPMSATP